MVNNGLRAVWFFSSLTLVMPRWSCSVSPQSADAVPVCTVGEPLMACMGMLASALHDTRISLAYLHLPEHEKGR
jgi:hypothetical protein